MSFARHQDLPPPGGYDRLNFSRKPAKQIISNRVLLGTYFVTSIASAFLAKMGVERLERERTEQRSSMLALLPMLTAERDRAYLKQLRRNRDEEAELMKNVEGWEVGTYFGEPVYLDYPEDTLLPKNKLEYYVHGSVEAMNKWLNFRLYS